MGQTQEVTYIISRHGGLHPEPQTRRDTIWCSWVQNGRIAQDGGIQSVGPPLIRNRVPGEGEEWPFPQVVLWRGELLGFGKASIYRTRELGQGMDILSSSLSNVNHPWSFGLVGEVLVGTNFQTTVTLHRDGVRDLVPSMLEAVAIPAARAMCAWQQRYWVGDYFAYQTRIGNKIMGSLVGRPEFRMENYKSGGGMVTLLLECTEYVDALRPLNQGAMLAYGPQGVEAIYPTGQRYPRYGRRVLTDKVGIMGPLAVVNAEGRQVFLGSDWNLYEATAESVERLGYAHHLETSTEGICPVLSLDRSRGDIYVCY